MVHFAPFHQNTLHAFNPRSSTKVEVFPGRFKSTYEQRAQRAISSILARLSIGERKALDMEYQHAGDRRFVGMRASEDGGRVALAVTYGSDSLTAQYSDRDAAGRVIPHDASWPVFTFHTIVRCDRSVAAWNCREEEVDAAASD